MVSASISASIRASLQKKADLELGKRAVLGSLVYFAAYVVVSLATSFPQDHPKVAFTCGFIILITSIVRFFWTLFREKIYSWNSRVWRIVCGTTILILGGMLGFLCGITLLWYGISQLSLLVLFITGGITSGAITSLCISLWLLRSYMVIAIIPPMIMSVALGTVYGYGLAFLIMQTLVFLLVQGKIQYNVYWEAITDNALLKIRQKEVEAAHKAAESANRAKSEFVASMSHEIRTPMNAILGMSEALSNAELTTEQRDYVRVIRNAGTSLLNLINDILDLSKVEAGHLELENIDFNLREMSEKTAEMMAVRAHEKGLELICQVMPEIKVQVKGDPYRLRQVLMNLLGNAIKFTEQGEIILRVEKKPDGKDNEIRFIIQDTGIGIDAEKKNAIFDAFTQGDASTTRKYGGTGLGLTISRRLVELMGGSMSVESEAGKGSTFMFDVVLPVQENPKTDVKLDAAKLQGLRVLVVDDNQTNRLILKNCLTSWGLEVSESATGQDAVRQITIACEMKRPFQLLLLDHIMPGMDGFQTAQKIRDEHESDNTIIMMLTSDRRSGDLKKASELGIASCLMKPIQQADLYDALINVLAPYCEVEEEKETVQIPAPNLPRRPLKVLLIEDNPENQFVVQTLLKDQPVELDFAGDGAEGVEKFKTGHYDLVLMDLQMPVMDGYVATKAIRQWEEMEARKDNCVRQGIPVIALTAHALREDTQKILDVGCNAHLTKPITKAALLDTIYKYGGGHSSWTEIA